MNNTDILNQLVANKTPNTTVKAIQDLISEKDELKRLAKSVCLDFEQNGSVYGNEFNKLREMSNS